MSDFLIDPQRLNLIKKRIKDEFAIKVSLSNNQSAGVQLLSAVTSFDAVEQAILRDIVTGESDGVLPSEQLDQMVSTNASTYVEVFGVDPFAETEIRRNLVGHIESYEDANENPVRYIEVALSDIRFRQDKFKYILDTKFKEIEVSSQTTDRQQLDDLQAQIQKQNGIIQYLQSLNQVYADSNDMLESERVELQAALERANAALDELTEQFDLANENLKKEIDKQAEDAKKASDSNNATASDIANAVKDLLKKIGESNSSGETPTILSPKITSITPTSVFRYDAFTLVLNGTDFEPDAQVFIQGIGKVTPVYINDKQLSVPITRSSPIYTSTGDKEITVLNPGDSKLSNEIKLTVKSTVINATGGRLPVSDTDSAKNPTLPGSITGKK